MINLESFKKVVGSAVYLRGEKLFALGAVKLGNVGSDSVSALVKGTHLYPVTLDWKNNQLKGSCECMAFSYQSLCKHCVAVALCVKHPELAGESDLVTDEQKIDQYLSSLKKSELLSALKNIVHDDEQLFKQVLLKAELANKPFEQKEVKKLITKALPKRSIWESHKVQTYFNNAETILDIFKTQLNNASPELQFTLWQKSLERLNQVLEQIDDSYGYRYETEGLIAANMASVFNTLPWSDKQKGQWLFDHFFDDANITLAIPNGFDLTNAVNAEFLALCQFAFDEYRVADQLAGRSFDYDMHRIGKVLLARAKSENSLHKQIKILAKLARTIEDYLAIGQLCLEHDDELSSEDWLLRSKVEIADDNGLRAWLNLAINIALANKDNNLAWRYAWQQFELRPHFNAYKKLVTVAEQTDFNLADTEEAIEQQLKGLDSHRAFSNDAVDYYIFHKQTDKLVSWCNSHALDISTCMSAGKYLLDIQSDHAPSYLAQGFNQMLVRADKRAYKQVVNEIRTLSEGVKAGSTQFHLIQGLVASIKHTHKAKTNLMKLFQQHLSQFLA